jgi:tripartite-type tricarboxylate transporter receptor subunit TctC
LAGNIAAVGSATAQNYPTKPIRLILSDSTGSPPDLLARFLAPRLAEAFKQPVLVDNRSGAGGTTGNEAALKANPDGYTMLLIAGTYGAAAALYKLPYDPVDDVAPVVQMGRTTFVIVVHPSLPVKSVEELIAYDKVNPGKLNYGTSGTGSRVHLGIELFNQMAGTRLTHVPYKGGGPLMNDLLGGQIQLTFSAMIGAVPYIRSNRLRAIAVTNPRRSSVSPDLPTAAETIPGYELMGYFGILGPKGLPREIIALWNSEINRILKLPDVIERMSSDGVELVGGPPEQFREMLRLDIAKWQKVVKTANIKPD